MNGNVNSNRSAEHAQSAPSAKNVGIAEVIASSISPPLSAELEKFAKSMQQLGELLARPEVQDAVVAIASKVVQFLAPFKPVFKVVGAIALVMGDSLSRLPDYMRDAVMKLANRGWFFDPEMSFIDMAKVAILILSGDPKEADAFMARHFEAKVDLIEAKLILALPHRARFFKSGFAAHRRGEFDLSILAFIAQSDGVSKELRGGFFFLGDRATRQPETAPYADAAQAHMYDQIVHLALKASLAIKAQMSKRAPDGIDALNRHAVMHGESLDYDTREGSLQALSLLNYLALALDPSDGSPLSTARATPFGSLLDSAGRANKLQGDGKTDVGTARAGARPKAKPARYPKA